MDWVSGPLHCSYQLLAVLPVTRIRPSPLGMQPMSCPRINFASSVTGVLGLTQSTPLCITSLTFMADLRYWVSGALDAMQHSPPFSRFRACDVKSRIDRQAA